MMAGSQVNWAKLNSRDISSEIKLAPFACTEANNEIKAFLAKQTEPVFNCNFRDYDRKRNIALVLQYEGTNFSGWQRQTNAPSVQAALEACLTNICQENIIVYGCSRTDAGVHARAYVASFYTNCQIPSANLPLACRSYLPEDISVLAAYEMPHTFNARFSTLAKTYTYDLVLSKVQPALCSRTTTLCYYPLDIAQIQQACALIVGEHDFRAFCGAKAEVNSYVRRVISLDASKADTGYPSYLPILRFRITGDGFLYNMVRIIAGTLMAVGAKQRSLEDVENALITGNRKLAGMTLAARGLTLEHVYYAKELPDLAVR
ncbi:tRNA pseudouridine synthase A [Amygdalobacter nucleatus]|uniref:tRNA pseudouridine synthase A n=2 Tax=Amygdalobacter nucleatus TaxID=3029274 RepID=A0A133Y6Z3_9FIRM|nr:tRNA pseudouridine synthase A [Amygdalobacter nucleatus]